MKKLTIGIAVVLLVLAVSVSCSSSAPARSVERTTVVTATQTVAVPAPATAPAPGPVASTPEVPERMIVRTGNMQLVVENVPTAMDRITRLAESMGGYVVSSNSWREGERVRGVITIRVTAKRFAEAMASLGGMAVDVTSQTTSSKDVTEEYVDLSAQLQNLQATEQQLLRIMEKAEKIDDVLAVQKELSRTREEIERTKGRMQYLERTSETSLIEVHLEQSKLDVKLSVSKRNVKEGETLSFQAEVGGGFAPYSYNWDFGDGATSTSPSPAHSYKSTGTYAVSVTVTDDRGNTSSDTRSDYIAVLSGWSPGNIASSSWNGLVSFLKVMASILIALGIFSPVWAVGGALVYWFWWRRRRSS